MWSDRNDWVMLGATYLQVWERVTGLAFYDWKACCCSLVPPGYSAGSCLAWPQAEGCQCSLTHYQPHFQQDFRATQITSDPDAGLPASKQVRLRLLCRMNSFTQGNHPGLTQSGHASQSSFGVMKWWRPNLGPIIPIRVRAVRQWRIVVHGVR